MTRYFVRFEDGTDSNIKGYRIIDFEKDVDNMNSEEFNIELLTLLNNETGINEENIYILALNKI